MVLVFIAALLLLVRWIVWEFGHARRHRIATHAYHLHKKSRGRVRQLQHGPTRAHAVPRRS